MLNKIVKLLLPISIIFPSQAQNYTKSLCIQDMRKLQGDEKKINSFSKLMIKHFVVMTV